MNDVAESGVRPQQKTLGYEPVLVVVWLVLIGCTLVSVGFAEGADLSTLAALFVCCIAVFKAHLVIDYLIGLRNAHPRIRKVMLGYVYLIVLIIALGIVFPQWIVRLTSL